MKKRPRIILFLAVTILTFAGMNRFIGHRYGCDHFRDHGRCGSEQQKEQQAASAQPASRI